MIDEKIKIGHDVWFDRDVTVFPGVEIGNGAVIESGSVVTKDVEPYSAVVGVSAEQIRWKFDVETRRQLLELEW